jgi:hypothetical protein
MECSAPTGCIARFGQVCEHSFSFGTQQYRGSPGEIVVPLSDPMCLTALDSIESRGTLPEGCNLQALLEDGLVLRDQDGFWTLTVQGRLRLANLRSLERQRQKR